MRGLGGGEAAQALVALAREEQGVEVATGDGAYARDCFRDSAEAFRDLCRRVVESSDELLDLTEREYRLLRAAREIARYEAFDDGTHVLGSSSQMGRA